MKVPKPRPAEKPSDRRCHLLNAAVSVFAKQGFDGATVKDLAQAAEMNIAMVSYYFKSKLGLYRACLESIGREKFAVIEKVLVPAQNHEDFQLKLKIWVEMCFQDHLEQPEVTQLIHQEIYQGLPYAKEVFKETFLKMFDVLVKFFEQAKRNKILRSELDPRTCVLFLQAGVMNIAATDSICAEFVGISIRDAKVRKKMIEQIIKMTLDGCTRGDS